MLSGLHIMDYCANAWKYLSAVVSLQIRDIASTFAPYTEYAIFHTLPPLRIFGWPTSREDLRAVCELDMEHPERATGLPLRPVV